MPFDMDHAHDGGGGGGDDDSHKHMTAFLKSIMQAFIMSCKDSGICIACCARLHGTELIARWLAAKWTKDGSLDDMFKDVNEVMVQIRDLAEGVYYAAQRMEDDERGK